MESITKIELENNARNFSKYYTIDFIKRIITEAQKALNDDFFEPIDLAWPWTHEDWTKAYRARKDAKINTKKAIEETFDELEDICHVLWHADYCEEATDEEIDFFFDIAKEAESFKDKLEEALEYIEEAEQAFEKLTDNLDSLKFLSE